MSSPRTPTRWVALVDGEVLRAEHGGGAVALDALGGGGQHAAQLPVGGRRGVPEQTPGLVVDALRRDVQRQLQEEIGHLFEVLGAHAL